MKTAHATILPTTTECSKGLSEIQTCPQPTCRCDVHCIACIPWEIQSVFAFFAGRVTITEVLKPTLVLLVVVIVAKDPVWAGAAMNMVVEVLATEVLNDVLTSATVGVCVDMFTDMAIIVLGAVRIPLEFSEPVSCSVDVLSNVVVDVLFDTLNDVVIGVVPSIGGADVEAGLNVDVFAVTITALKFARPAPLGELSC